MDITMAYAQNDRPSLNFDLWMQVCRYVGFMDVIAVSQLGRWFRSLAEAYFVSAYHMELLKYVKNPKEFRGILRSHHAVIYGVFAVDFVIRLVNPLNPPTLYISIPPNSLEAFFCLFLREGYATMVTKRIPSQFGYRANPSVFDKIAMRNSQGCTVVLVWGCLPSTLAPVAHQPSTAPMTYMTADGICIPYPLATTRYHCLENMAECRDDGSDRMPYRARSFMYATFGSCRVYMPSTTKADSCSGNAYCPNTLRSFGDCMCLQFIFSPEHATSMVTQHIMPCWRWGGVECRGSCGKKTVTEVSLVRRQLDAW